MTDYRGLDVSQITTLRAKLRDDGSDMQVIKNSLARLAFQDAGITPPEDMLLGPTAVVLLYEDLAGPAKTLKQFIKDTEDLQIKGGLMGGDLLTPARVEALADLPTKPELQATFLGVLQAPMRNFVTVTSAPLRNLLTVISAYSQTEAEAA